MKNDIERTADLLKDFGLKYETGTDEDGNDQLIVRQQYDNEKILGFGGSVIEFAFDKDGTFVNVGSWE